MERQVQQKFIRGINRRFSIQNQDDPTRVYTCQNARLQQRGETGQVARINGFEPLANLNLSAAGVTVLDSIMYLDTYVVLWAQSNDVKVSYVNINDGTFTTQDLGTFADVSKGDMILLEDTIFVVPFNIQLNNFNGTFYVNDFKSETPVVIVVEDAYPNPFSSSDPGTVGYLEMGEVYWYLVRIVYEDNHKTVTSFPQRVKIESTREVGVVVNLPEDLDGGFVRVEIFRRKGEGGFFLIDRVRTDSLINWVYTDFGKSNISAFSDQNYVWADSAEAQAIVRDRLVLGNLNFKDRDFVPNVSVDLVSTVENESLVPNTTFEIYSRKRFSDGMVSAHEQVGLVVPTEFDKTIEIDQIGSVEKENAFYLGYDRSNKTVDKLIPFPTLEIYNAQVPSIETNEELVGDQNRPVNPHIFLGFAQIVRQFFEGNTIRHGVQDAEWGNSGVSGFDWFDSTAETPVGFENIMPIYIDLEVVSGQVIRYKRIATNTDDGTVTDGVYQIAWLDGLKEYITLRGFSCNIDGVDSGYKMSTNRTISNFLDIDIKIVGFFDQTDQFGKPYRTESTSEVTTEFKNRVYLIADVDSILSDFDADTFNNLGVKPSGSTWGTTPPDFTKRVVFNLLNIEYIEDNAPTAVPLTIDGVSHVRWDYVDKVVQPVPEINLDNSVIYLGSTSGTGTKTYPAGIEKVDNGDFVYWRLPRHAILEGLITSDDLEIFQEEYENLLIWSEPFLIGTGINGIRNFTFTNFKTISQNYGPIVDIQYINKVLLVFCERGVNQINVGETLTQQTSGEVFVSSAQFLTNDYWILRNIPQISVESMKEYENMLFFCDGRDVWTFIDGLKNITNGSIEIGTVKAAAIDPLNKEYRLTTTTGTWAYSIELGEWFGPYTYEDVVSTEYKDRIFSVVGDHIVEHNKGNTFNGTEYETVIESVSLDLGNVAVDKLWRKFLLQLDGTIPDVAVDELMEFAYGRDYDAKVIKDLFEVAKKSNLFHIGIVESEKNSTQLYWQIRTDIANFTLRSFAYDLSIRNRP